MSWHSVSLSDVAATPWRNGGGVTRELLAWPDADSWRVRMSVADVAQDGPFSRFEGVQRWFAVLDGAGVHLRLKGELHALTPGSEPFVFDGGVDTDCTLIAGATRDFNLMLRGASGRMGRLAGKQAFGCSGGELIALYSGAGPALASAEGDDLEIGPQTLAWRILEAAGAVQLEAAGALWMEIAP
jgi:hypothetical protein